MFHLATLTLGLIVALRFVPQLPIPRALKYGLGAALLVVSQHHLLTRLVWGNMFSPEVPRAAMIAVNWLFGTILLLAGVQLVLEVVRAIASLARRRWLTVPVSIASLLGAAALLVSGYGVAQAIRLPMPDIERAIAGAPDGVPIILMYHQPGRAAEASKARVALQLSGHTHGGMIRGFDRLIAKYNSGFVSGLYNVAGMPLYVGNGTPRSRSSGTNVIAECLPMASSAVQPNTASAPGDQVSMIPSGSAR